MRTVEEISCNLGVWGDDVNEAEDWDERHADKPHDHFLPQRQRLQEAHLRTVPDACQVLLTVGMSYKLQPQQQHNSPFQDRRQLF